MKHITFILILLTLVTSCTGEEKRVDRPNTAPVVSADGLHILFPNLENLSFFKTETINNKAVTAKFTAPARIATTIISSKEGAERNIVLFENPELAGHYSQLMQHRINIDQIQNTNIRQRQIELERIKDLNLHGAATGQDLINAESALSMEKSGLANERVAMMEHESKLVSAGFTPDVLRKSKIGTAFLISDIPENQVDKVEIGNRCTIQVHSFPNESFTGTIDTFVDVVDPITRMVKVRIRVDNSSYKLKAGMFANVSFDIRKDNQVSISKNALVTIQGKNYVFIKTSDNAFKRTEIQIGQQIGDRIIVFNGLSDQEEVAIAGVMQLKGLSFGY